MSKCINRRAFMKTTAATGAGLTFFPNALAQEDPPVEDSGDKSRVVEVHSPGVMTSKKKADYSMVQEMIDRGIMELTGEEDLGAAWSCFVGTKDVVGLKVNGGGGIFGTHKAVLESVIAGIKKAGVPGENIVVWDQVTEYLEQFYFKRMKIDCKKLGVRFAGCTPALRQEHYQEGKPLPGFETEPVEFPWGKVKVAELVANELTAIINLPILKDHGCSGVTLALKNISHAVVDVPWLCHGDCCDPYIADIVNIPSVRNKLRLHILDGLVGQADGGPGFTSWDVMFKNEKILFSCDPVAVDALGREWIVKARADLELPVMEEADNAIPGIKGRAPKHIATAASKGLGVDDPARIDVCKVNLGAEEEAGQSKEG